MAEITSMTVAHEKWDEFCKRLMGPQALDVRQNADGETIWSCRNDFRHTKAILAKIGNIDIESSVAYFREHSCYCDCEVMLNLALVMS